MSETTMMPDILPDAEVLDPKNPLLIARLFLASKRTPDALDTLAAYRGSFFRWEGAFWRELEAEELRRLLYHWLEVKWEKVTKGGVEIRQPFLPNKGRLDNIIDAMRSESHIRGTLEPPLWLHDDNIRPAPQDLLPARNGLVDLLALAERRNDYLLSPTPAFFNTFALDYAFRADAPRPDSWLSFLESVWGDDEESIALLQEWFGCNLTVDTRHHKALLVVGPKRSGKGTIARVMRGLVGNANVAGPTLASLATNFGLWPLLHKTAAIISDARLSSRSDQSIITERILSITGEDALTIDRKNLSPVTCKLLTRLTIFTNELPKLSDSSGALASRFLILTMRRSFFGCEDKTLGDRLMGELPGILLWAIEGWRRLRERGAFTVPASSVAAVNELQDLASPITAFLEDRCVVGAGHSVERDELYAAWVGWCTEQGREHPGTKPSFGRDLAAAVPGLGTSQRRTGIGRIRTYEGVGLAQVGTCSTPLHL